MKKAKTRFIVKTKYGEGNGHYQRRIKKTIIKALNTHPRIALIRLDLRFPRGGIIFRYDAEVITRFFKSLNEKFPVYLKKRATGGVRVHDSSLRYFWVREFNQCDGKHYHIALLVNWDSVCYVNSFYNDNGSFYTAVADAWLSAIGVEDIGRRCLVHIPKNSVYKLARKELDEKGIDVLYEGIKERFDYLIKLRQKKTGDGERNFGCSQK